MIKLLIVVLSLLILDVNGYGVHKNRLPGRWNFYKYDFLKNLDSKRREEAVPFPTDAECLDGPFKCPDYDVKDNPSKKARGTKTSGPMDFKDFWRSLPDNLEVAPVVILSDYDLQPEK